MSITGNTFGMLTCPVTCYTIWHFAICFKIRMHAVLWPYINWETRVFVFLKWFCHTAGQINVNYNWTSAKNCLKIVKSYL